MSVLALMATCALGLGTFCAADDGHDALAQEIIAATGVKGGLIVHVGCGDGKLTAALCANDSYVVHGLDASAKNVAKAREHIRSLKLYGKVSVEQWRQKHLPYTDNLVNLVVSEKIGKIPMDEVLRVLAPNGVAYIKKGRKWTKTVKPRPKEIDEWTHFLHDATGNAVANDSVVAPPHHVQWIGGPKWARSHDHLASVSVAVSSGGRVFYIVDEGPIASVALAPTWFLVARDAFNGVLLWKRPIASWEWHLRDFRSGPSQVHRRLVAEKDRVYVTLGYGAPLTALDAATGKTVKTYEATEGTEEILHHEGVLFLVVGNPNHQRAMNAAIRRGEPLPPVDRSIMALNADTGDVLWRRSDTDTAELMPMTLAVGGGRAFFQSTGELICMDARSGQELWRAARPASLEQRPAWSAPTVVVHGDVVYSADREAPTEMDDTPRPRHVDWLVSRKGGDAPVGELIAFSAKTGERLWSCPCREAYNAPVDVLIAGGLLWTGNLVRSKDPGITEARDPATGDIKKQRPADDTFFVVGMGHHRCHRNKATDRFLLLGRAGVEFIDLASGKGIAHHWIRGTCQYGILPCNGLLYLPPHSCACYIQAKLNGFNALAPKRESKVAKHVGPRLERGPAYGKPTASEAAGQADWPTYRHDPARSGRTSSAVPAVLKRSWHADLGGKLSSVVLAEGKVFVASVDTHAVHALDARSGRPLWSYTVGGRVDSPPTIHKGLALFGCADGCVYCLRASDGRLAWRFRAAPEDRRVVAYGQLESVWPVHGSVLVQDGVAYFAAGRSIFVDGGIYLYSLDPVTGKKLSQTRLDGRHPKTGQEPQDTVRGTNMPGVLPDVLASDGTFVYMRHKAFDRNGVEQEPSVPHLYSPAGFLDDSWWHRTYWIVGTRMGVGYGGWPTVGNSVPSGRLLVLDAPNVYGFGRDQYATHGSHVGLGMTQYRLFAADATPKPVQKPVARRRGKGPGTQVQYYWSKDAELLVRAMVLADKTLFVAGPPDLPDRDDDGLAALQGGKGGVLWAVSTTDGEKLAEYKLDSPPVFDGMIAANGQLYISTRDGRVLCMGKE